MYQDYMGPWDHFWSHWFQFWGTTSSIGDLVTTWEDDCNQSSATASMVVPLWNFLGILRNSKFGNSVPTSKNYTEAKRGESSEKCFQNMEVNIIYTNLVFMDLTNPFGVSGDVTWYIDMHNPNLFIFWNTKLHYISATTQVAAKENEWAKP